MERGYSCPSGGLAALRSFTETNVNERPKNKHTAKKRTGQCYELRPPTSSVGVARVWVWLNSQGMGVGVAQWPGCQHCPTAPVRSAESIPQSGFRARTCILTRFPDSSCYRLSHDSSRYSYTCRVVAGFPDDSIGSFACPCIHSAVLFKEF